MFAEYLGSVSLPEVVCEGETSLDLRAIGGLLWVTGQVDCGPPRSIHSHWTLGGSICILYNIVYTHTYTQWGMKLATGHTPQVD